MHAAKRHDLGAVYRTINLLAPKRRYDLVRVRGTHGELLEPHQEFQECFRYFEIFEQVLSSPEVFLLPRRSLAFLQGRPQYAYCPNRAIDESINRVMKHCGEVRDKSATPTVHDRHAGKSIKKQVAVVKVESCWG